MLVDQYQSAEGVTLLGLQNSFTSENKATVPGRLRVADLNADGYPDVTMTLKFRNSTNQEYTHTVILLNQENEETGAREFTNVRKDDDSLLYKIISTAGSTGDLVTFVDIDENGRLDVIVQKFDETTQAPTLVVLYNGVITDNFFMKALFVNSEQTKS